MSTLRIDVTDDLAGILGEIQQPIDKAALELIVMELYRRNRVSSGRAAELLGMSRLEFIQHASGLGISYLRVDEEDLDREIQVGRTL